VESVILLDTHVVAWAYAGELGRIPRAVARRMDAEPLAISPFVLLELQYLYETGRTTEPAQAVLDDLRPRLELTVADVSAETVCAAALPLWWTRDPFDRLISAHALLADLPLVTKDAVLLERVANAWWG
jgi:PIN domain nuclease of toxin-antitoxin system